MPRIIHVRRDAATERMLRRLKRRLGWSDSRVVREGIKLLNRLTGQGGRRIVGLGRFSSGIPDRGSNKAQLKTFGR
jgi:hypothetical protein